MSKVFLLVGPHGIGKSYLAMDISQNSLPDTEVLSSDDYRDKFSDGFTDRLSLAFQELSYAAFKALKHDLELYMGFPVHRKNIIVDSTGLNITFREEIRDLAFKNHYECHVILLDYPLVAYKEKPKIPSLNERHRGSIYHVKKYIHSEKHTSVGIYKTYENAYKGFETCNNSKKVASPTADYIVSSDDYDSIIIFGDIHNNLSELMSIMAEAELLPNSLVIGVGDYLDKGEDLKGVLSFLLCTDPEKVILVEGNHERFLYLRLTGEAKPIEEALEDKYFTSLKTLQQDEKLREKFFQLYKRLVPFVKLKSDTRPSIYVTHAPCKKEFLGKTSQKAMKAQRNIRFDRQEENPDILNFIVDEAGKYQPLHVFGHVPSTTYSYKNKISLDGGLGSGGGVRAAIFRPIEGSQLWDIEFKFYGEANGIDIFKSAKRDTPNISVDRNKLEPRQRRFLENFVKDRKFISGTMCPAPADIETLDIESLDKAIELFLKAGQEIVVAQPKFMGSRCQIYLFHDKPHFATSRQGYMIKHEGIEAILEATYQKYKDTFKEELILDGELLPWAFLGKGLIEGQYDDYLKAIKYRNTFLKGVANSYGKFDEEDEERITIFEEQLKAFTDPNAKEEFTPFDILYKDGEVLHGQTPKETFNFLDTDWNCYEFDLTSSKDIDRLKLEFGHITDTFGMEGIVLKASTYPQKGQIPMLKVRSKKYLTLVYGYDYNKNIDKLCKSKNIAKKLRLSQDEFYVGTKMLSSSGDELMSYAAFMQDMVTQESVLDPRL
jgi:predicted kinase